MSNVSIFDDMNEDTAYDAGEVDAAAQGSVVPPGFYMATLKEVKDRTTQQERSLQELMFEITEGRHAKRQVQFSIWTDVAVVDAEGNEKSPEKIAEEKARAKNQFIKAGYGLGLFVKKVIDGKEKYVITEGMRNFRDVIDATCIIETKTRTYKNKDGEDKTSAEVTMFGVLPVTDENRKKLGEKKAGEKPDAKSGAAAAPGSGGKSTGASATGKPAPTKKSLAGLL